MTLGRMILKTLQSDTGRNVYIDDIATSNDIVNPNMLTNPTFAIATPDSSIVPPDGTPRDYAIGEQVFSNWYSEGVVGVTYINGVLNATSGSLTQTFTLFGGLESVTNWTASFKNSLGEISTDSVSYVIVNDKLTVTINLTTASDVTSVKIEDGTQATNHTLTDSEITQSLNEVAIANNVRADQVAPLKVSTVSGVSYFWDASTQRTYYSPTVITGTIADFEVIDENQATITTEYGDFELISPLWRDYRQDGDVRGWGAVGDAIISKAKPLYYAINGFETITNDNATDDTFAIRNAIQAKSVINFNGELGYLVSDIFTITDSNKIINGNGAIIVYRGGKSVLSEDETGIFQFNGVINREASPDNPTPDTAKVAVLVQDIPVFSNELVVETSTNTVNKGDYFHFKARNSATSISEEIILKGYYLVQARAVIDNEDGTSTIYTDYKCGFPYLTDEVELTGASPITNCSVKDFILIDEMAATPTSPELPIAQAPTREREEAVGLVRFFGASNITAENLQSYNGKWSTVETFICSNVKVDNIRTFTPVWYGGGEGYCLKLSGTINGAANNLSMIGGRHVFDAYESAWIKVEDSHGETDQIAFSLHTGAEHDIEFKNCSGGDFYLANEAYGKVCARVTLDNCNFNLVRINCLDMTIKNSQLNDFTAVCGKISIENTDITEFKTLSRETRSGYADAMPQTAYGECYIDSSSNITRAKSFSSTKMSNWLYLNSLNRWTTIDDSESPFLFIENCNNVDLKGNLRETLVLFTGAVFDINTDGLRADVSIDGVYSLLGITGMNINENSIQRWRLTNMNLNLTESIRPYQIVGRSDAIQSYKAQAVIGGNTFTNCNQAIIGDTASNGMLDLIMVSSSRDTYSNGYETLVQCVNDSAKYQSGDTEPTKGSTGGPAMWDGSTWIDLV